ncbi:epoxyqueuosine reductase QueH [Butyrivibrio proteoclasticus]|uniref:epoxyqueuosine reductase QueH n=1 Tax=Butyrivibrio proteoclasticus TaxID=43305 RepID=UPI00047A5969|nr:epoxyqueuosine reductase QueH [Butyrivibrio proteoclasticus]
MNKRNYAKELDNKIEEFQKQGIYPRLLLHACCAPCSSYCLEFLRNFFDVTVFFYNPNITEEREYQKRVEEEKRLIGEYNKNRQGTEREIQIIEGNYEPKEFYDAAKGLEDCKEGGERCRKCFELRLFETARIAVQEGFEFFTTTLTISPLKNADVLNEVGEQAQDAVNSRATFLPSDFKKKNGYKRSIELSKEYGLYRQDYCGCSFSKAERNKTKNGETTYETRQN